MDVDHDEFRTSKDDVDARKYESEVVDFLEPDEECLLFQQLEGGYGVNIEHPCANFMTSA